MTSTTDPPAPSSSSTTGDEPSTSTGTPVSWNRYTFDVDNQTWSSTPLSELWSAANAPPSSGISAAVSLTHFDRLWVLANDGTFYERVDGAWVPPTPLAQRFPMTAGMDVGAMVHTPGQMNETQEDVFFVDNPMTVIYVQHENGGLDYIDTVMLEDERGAAPQASQRVEWYLARTDPTQIGMAADWLVWFVAFDDGNMWTFNAAFEWNSYPLDDNEFFQGVAGEPDPFTIEAAYYDDAFEQAHFIGP